MKTNQSRLPVPLFMTEGFRFFFLFSAIFALISIVSWLLALYSTVDILTIFQPSPSMPITQWHGHEMVFGFSIAVVSGFFLTAVPNWTQTPPAKAAYIITIALLWLLGRVAMWQSESLNPWLVAFADMIFLPPLLIKTAYSLRKNPQMHNVVFVSLLAVLILTNGLIHAEWIGITEETATPAIRTSLVVIGMMVMVIGGRVVPAFTRNAMRRRDMDEADMPYTHPLANKLALLSSILFVFTVLLSLPDWAQGLTALLAAVGNAWRFSGWRSFKLLNEPIVWSLHLGYAMLVLALFAFALAGLTDWIAASDALHVMGIGAIGGMTMAVMSRASLGHTGRKLKVRPVMALAYSCLAFAALARAFGPVFLPDFYEASIWLSAAFWLSGFAIFLHVYRPILVGPRLR